MSSGGASGSLAERRGRPVPSNTPGGAPVKVGRDGYVMDRGQNVRG